MALVMSRNLGATGLTTPLTWEPWWVPSIASKLIQVQLGAIPFTRVKQTSRCSQVPSHPSPESHWVFVQSQTGSLPPLASLPRSKSGSASEIQLLVIPRCWHSHGQGARCDWLLRSLMGLNVRGPKPISGKCALWEERTAFLCGGTEKEQVHYKPGS